MFKTLALLALVQAAAAGAQWCSIPLKYTLETNTACAGADTGYTITGYCQTPFHPDTVAVGANPTVTHTLTAATALAWTLTTADPSNPNCVAPGTTFAWTTGANFQASAQPNLPNACGASAALPFAAQNNMDSTASTTVKGVSIVCDTANNYYVAAGVEGAATCLGTNMASGDNLFNLIPSTTTGVWSATFGLLTSATQTSTWAAGTLTCNQGCTIPSPYCATNTYHANVLFWGSGVVTGTCLIRPGTTAQLYCRSDPFTAYTATCTAAGTAATAGTLTWSTTPNCGDADGASTGYYILTKPTGVQNAGAITGFGATASTSAKLVTATLGQWGGRITEPFQAAATYQVAITGCPTDGTNGECVQKTVNYWRCMGLTIDSATVCYAARTRIACPTHTNGFRCPSSSKKGLLGLLGLIGLVPLLLCLLLLCLLLPCLLRRKKTEGDVHFATFDPHAAPLGGSIAPGFAPGCAPSIGFPAY